MVCCHQFNSNRYEWMSCGKKGDIWNVRLKVIVDEGLSLTFNFSINPKTAEAKLTVRGNKSLDTNNPGGQNSVTYEGVIREN